MSSGLLVIPGVSTLPCLPLMLSLKTIILKYLLVGVFLVSPWCVHRDRRPDQTVSVVPSPRFVLFVFSSVLFVPEFCPSRQASPLVESPHARGSQEFTPPFAALPSRGSREFTPPFAALPSRRSWEFTPPFAKQPAHSSQVMTPPSTANPSPPARRWLNARRPASDSMPAGLPLTQCPPACLLLKPAGLPLTQARRIAADSSSPDCRWLMPAGRRWQGKPTQPLSVHAAVRGSPNPPFAGDHAAVRGESQPTVGGSLWYAGKANPPSMVHSARSRLWLLPARRPLPLSGQASRLLPLLSSQPIMVSPAGRCRIDKPAGRGRIWPDSDHGLFNCLCVFSPEGLLIPLSFPKEILGGGSRDPAEETEVGAGAAASRAPCSAMASRAPCSTWTSVCLFHSGGPVLCMYLCRSCGVSRVPTPPPR